MTEHDPGDYRRFLDRSKPAPTAYEMLLMNREAAIKQRVEWHKAMADKYGIEVDDGKEPEVMSSEEYSGHSNSIYHIPEGSKDLADLIEHKDMNFAIGNIFKACYRYGEKPMATKMYDIDKIIYFAEREKNRLLSSR